MPVPDHIDPNQYIISRKRKKYRFAKFFNAPNCFEYDEWTPRPIDVVEVGAGTALFSVELAALHPDLTYLALDVKADRLQKGAYEALARGIDNVYFVRARADQIDQLITPHSLTGLWVTFPDPFPRQRSAGRRLSHPTFLAKYANLLRPEGMYCLKHDDQAFFCWSLEQLVATGWTIDQLSFDLQSSLCEGDCRVLTSYERRWLDEGRRTHFVAARAPAGEK